MLNDRIDDAVKATVFNSPHPLNIHQLLDILDDYPQGDVVRRAMVLGNDEVITMMVEDGTTLFVP